MASGRPFKSGGKAGYYRALLHCSGPVDPNLSKDRFLEMLGDEPKFAVSRLPQYKAKPEQLALQDRGPVARNPLLDGPASASGVRPPHPADAAVVATGTEARALTELLLRGVHPALSRQLSLP